MGKMNTEDSIKRISQRSYRTSKKISIGRERVEVLGNIAEKMIEMGEDEKAEEILEKSLESDKNISLSITKESNLSATSLKL